MAILLRAPTDRLLKPPRWEVQPEFSDNPGFWRGCVAFAMPNGETTQDDIPNLAPTKYGFQSYSSTIAQPEAEDIGPAMGYSIDGTRVAEALQVAETDFTDTYLTGAGACTVGVYIKYPALNTSGVDAFAGAWSHRTGSSARQKKILLCDINGTAYFYCRNAGNTAEVFAAGTATKTPFKAWSMAVGVFDAGAIRIYINGVRAGSASLGSSTINSTSDTEPFELVGGHFTTISQTWSPRFHHGYSFFHNRALTDVEIAELYADPFGPVRESRKSYFVPAATAGVTALPGPGSAAGAGTQPTVAAAVAAAAGPGSSSGAGTQPTVTVGVATQPGPGTATGDGTQPTVAAAVAAAAGPGAATGDGTQPTVTVGALVVAPGPGAATGGGVAPTVAAAVAAAIGPGTANGLGTTPTVAAAALAAIGPGSATAAGLAPVVQVQIAALPGPGSANGLGTAPVVTAAILAAVGAGSADGAGTQPLVIAGNIAGRRSVHPAASGTAATVLRTGSAAILSRRGSTAT